MIFNKHKERKPLTGNKYQILAARTIDSNLNKSKLLNHSLHGISAEVGELHGLFQKVYQGHKIDREHVKKELGDILWFIAEFCTCNGWLLEDVMYLNIEKLQKRYPQGFEAEKSLNRKEGDI